MPAQDNLASIIARIKALQAKTTSAGASEHEALAAAAKARELIEKYQINMSEAELRSEGTTRYAYAYDKRTHEISWRLSYEIARFTETKVWKQGSDASLQFLGLRSDIEFAHWLLVHLTDFVASETLEYSMNATTLYRQHIEDFQAGCCKRINERLAELTASRQPAASGKALIVLKGQLIEQHFSTLGINLRKATRQQMRASEVTAQGYQAGDRANFARPTSHAPAALIAKT